MISLSTFKHEVGVGVSAADSGHSCNPSCNLSISELWSHVILWYSMTIHPGPRHPGPWHKTSWPGLVSRVGSSLPPPLSILVAPNPARSEVPPEISDVVTKGSAAAAWLWPSLPPNSASLEWIQQLFPKFGKRWSWCKRVGSILRSVSLHNSRTNFLV